MLLKESPPKSFTLNSVKMKTLQSEQPAQPKLLSSIIPWCLFVLFACASVGLYIQKERLNKENANLATEAEKECLRSDSIEAENNRLKAPLTPELLQYKLEIVSQHYEWSKDFASLFTAIARRESGDCLCKGACQRTNCVFGFHARPRSEHVISHYNNGHGEILSVYESLENSLHDAVEWVIWNPPAKGEPFDVNYLKRRGYNNHIKGYYLSLESLRL